jgi:hypothetical protein
VLTVSPKGSLINASSRSSGGERSKASWDSGDFASGLLGVSAALAVGAIAALADDDEDDIDFLVAREDYKEWAPDATEPTTGISYPQRCQLYDTDKTVTPMRFIGTGLRYVHLHFACLG